MLKEGEALSKIVACLPNLDKKYNTTMKALTVNDVKEWAHLLGMLGLEKYGKGNTYFDNCWNDNMRKIKTDVESHTRSK